MWLEYLRIAARVLRAHPFRSLLTVVSITLGALSIVLMTSLAQSGLATLSRSLEELGGARILIFFPNRPERAEDKQTSYAFGLTRQDAELLSTLPHLESLSLFAILGPHEVLGDTGKGARTDVVAGDGETMAGLRLPLGRGRSYTAQENRERAKVCVVGHELARKLYAGDAVGHFITVLGTRCRIIGQLRDEDRMGMNFGFDWRDNLLMPIETARELAPKLILGSQILIKTDDAAFNDIVKRIGNALMVERRHGIDDFRIVDFATFMDKFHQVLLIMRIIVGLLAGVALIVGGIGVMNMMLISVSERVREIGIRKAIGASPRDIAAQFLCESMVLAGLGGLVGVAGGAALALLASFVIKQFQPSWVGVIAFDAVTVALSVSVGIGLLFGVVPARRASQLDPVEAMRR